MDKQKQIEELRGNLSNILTYGVMKIYPCDQIQPRELIAEYLIEQGYRKIPENAVVLTREECDKLKYENEVYLMEGRKVCQMEVETRHELEKLKKDFDYNLVQERRTIRKETAERFAEMAHEAFFGVNCIDIDEWNWYQDKIAEILKEITEGTV